MKLGKFSKYDDFFLVYIFVIAQLVKHGQLVKHEKLNDCEKSKLTKWL